jgi:SAM-dependent methyltransferase
MEAPRTESIYVKKFTRYMARVEEIVSSTKRSGLEILDMPAGYGLLAERLRQLGHKVTCADFNSLRPDYVFVDMEKRLPFEDSSFDAVICLEGIEHVIDPYSLIREICRVVRAEGFVILSLPNVQSLFSRLNFLFTGTFYQFDPERHRHPQGGLIDRGHVSPLSLVQLHYIFGEFGLMLRVVTGDRIKKKILFPIYCTLWASNVVTLWLRRRRRLQSDDVIRLYRFSIQFRSMLSRSLITVWGKATDKAR